MELGGEERGELVASDLDVRDGRLPCSATEAALRSTIGDDCIDEGGVCEMTSRSASPSRLVWYWSGRGGTGVLDTWRFSSELELERDGARRGEGAELDRVVRPGKL